MPSHEFSAFYSQNSRLLILGSFPSVKSREQAFYYAHPQNRFWRVICACLGRELCKTEEQKREMLYDAKIALWDVIESCDITGSSDMNIKNAVPTDIAGLIAKTEIRRIILNGRTAERFFLKFQPDIALPRVFLPSTSPANASWSLERLIEAWRPEIEYVKEDL